MSDASALERPPREGSQNRLLFLDWTRGLAAVIMLQGHTFHSFSRNELRPDGPYVLSQFFGGIAPAIFLFLTGITFAFSMDRADRKGLSVSGRVVNALHRARYLFTLAFLFRFQLWLFSQPWSSWADLFKVDILNCMGFAMTIVAFLSIPSIRRRARWAAGIGIGIAALSPLVSGTDWNWVHPFVRAYFQPSYNYFSFFPWAAFLAFGISAGCVLRLVRAQEMHRLMLWVTALGFGLILGGQYFSNLPYSVYTKSEFWLDSPGLVVVKLGVVNLILAFAFLWTEHASGGSFSWIRSLGGHSLIVYWVHIELVYGRWFGFWKEQLTTAQCALFSAVLILAMVGLTVIKGKWDDWRRKSSGKSTRETVSAVKIPAATY